ncbi:very large low complexity [Cryptosporidium xiaoi]|uniref:Very large low complexity n=1 Tax=Cryptosporidium xiaoi TaxID=659607 RepID=A0AAV9XXK8_9CRYT
MNKDRSEILLESCSRSLLSYQLYIRDKLNNGNANTLIEFEDIINVKIPKLIKSRLSEYSLCNYIPAAGTKKKDIFEGDDVLKALEVCFRINRESAKRILNGYNNLSDSGLIVKFTNIESSIYSEDESKCNYHFLDQEFLSKIYDFILRDQIALLDSIKFMYDHATFETGNFSFGSCIRNICFNGVIWTDNEFNILDELWKWYSRLVDSEFIEFDDPIIENIFGNPLVQCYYRMILESNILHTILVILQSLNSLILNSNNNKSESNPIILEINKNDDSSLIRTTSMNRCKVILSKLQSHCFLGSLYTLYSDKNGIKINTLSYCDNALAHSSIIMDQLRQTSTNGILLACSLVLSLSPKSITTENEDLSFLINIVITFLESLSSNDPGEIIQKIKTENALNNNFNTPVKAISSSNNKNQQRFVRGNLILVHAKIVKPLLPGFIFAYASIVAQTPNSDTLLVPIISRSTFFESSAFADSLENMLTSLNSQNPVKQCVLVKFDSLEDNNTTNKDEKTLIGESFGTYYQYYIVYGLIRNTISTFSLNVLPFTAKITGTLSKLLRKEPRLVFRECWRGDYFRQIGVHIILEMYTSFFPYGIVEFVDLLSSLLPDFNLVSKSSKMDMEMAKQALKLFMEFIRSSIKFINFPPYLNSLSLTPLQINDWNPETIRKGKVALEFPLHVEASSIEVPNFTSGSSFSQSSLSGTLEGCILEFLDVKLDDVTPLSVGFPSARKCLTPLRVLSTGVSQRVPLKSLLLENSETSFSYPLWSTSPYGLTYDFPESEMPPYFHINESKHLDLPSPNKKTKITPYLDINNISHPSDLPKNSSEIKLGDLDPFTIQFCNNIGVISGTNINTNPGTSNIGLSSQDLLSPIPSLLKILLLIWDAISLSFYQKKGNITNKKLLEMFVSLSELIYKLVSFNRSFVFVLEQEISNWNALVPNFHSSRSHSSSSARFGMLTIKLLQALRGFNSLISNENSDEFLTHIFYTLPRLIHILNVTMKPINLLSIEDALNYNFSRLGTDNTISNFHKSSSQNEDSFVLQPPWMKVGEDMSIPMYWLVPLLLSNSIVFNSETGISGDINILIGNDNGGPYTSLLKGIQGFDIDELFNLVTKTIEIVEKQLKSYPISNQVLQFIGTLLEYCPVLFWGFGWDRHGKIILNSVISSIQNKNKITNPSVLRIQKDLQLLLNDSLSFQSTSLESKKDSFGLFSRISNFTIHSVLSRIQSWQFRIDSERNLLLLASINTLSLLLDSMNSITLIGDFEKDEVYDEMEKTINNNVKENMQSTGNNYKYYLISNNQINIASNGGSGITTLKDIIPNISFITSSNYQSLIVTLLKHLIETGLIPTLLSLLSCEYEINSRAIKKSTYISHYLNRQDNLVNAANSKLKDSSSSSQWVLLLSNSIVSQSMTKNESTSYCLAMHMQQSNSQRIFMDRLLFQPLDCYFSVPDNLGELFCLPDVIVSQQIVSKVLEILYIIFNSVSDTNSTLLKTFRTSLLRWILSSSTTSSSAGIHSINSRNNDFNITFDEPKFTWSDSDLVAQHIYDKVNKLYQQKKPQMNVIKSLLVTILSYTPSTFPFKAPLLASRLLSSLCYALSAETDYNNINKKDNIDLILEQILKPPISINSIQQDFLLYLTNTKLFPILNRILFQELDFILLAPIFQFLQIFNPKNDKITIKEKYSLSMVQSVIELLILIATSHPSIIVCSTGSFNHENSTSMINICKKYITINSSISSDNELKYFANSRVRLICLALSKILENINILIENYLIKNDIDTECDKKYSLIEKLNFIITLIPNIFNLLTQLIEDSRSRNLLIKEIFDPKTEKHPSNNTLSNSFLKIIVETTKNSVKLLDCIFKLKLSKSNSDINQHIVLNMITTLSSSITCVYHVISRIIGITTYLSSKDSDELPFILKNQELFEFIQFLLSDNLIHEILHSKQMYNYLLDKFMESSDHFSIIDKELSIPIEYCVLDYNESNFNHKKRYKLSKDENSEGTNINLHEKAPRNSLEQFVIKYYYERYLKFSQLIISNETIHDLTEFNIYKTQKFKESMLNNNENNQNSFEINNQTIESVSIDSSNTSQLASLEMVWESGQLLAPKQHLSPKTIIYEKKESHFENSFSKNLEIDIFGNGSEQIINKQSLINTRNNNFSEANIMNDFSNNLPGLLVVRNSSFIYKTRQWGHNYEIDLYSLLILLTCYTAAFISVPHGEMSLEEFLNFSLKIYQDTRNDNIRRSFIESFMYLLASYNQLLFYLKSVLPVIIVNSRKNISESKILHISTTFDNTKLGFLSHCVNLTQEYQYYGDKKVNNYYPNLLMTIIFSTCTDLMTFDLLSSIKLILGRVEMIKTSMIIKNQIKNRKDDNAEIKDDEPFLDISLVSPNSSTVCLSPLWQDQVPNLGTKLDYSNSKQKNNIIDDNCGIKNKELGFIIGNLTYFSPLSKYSDKTQRENFKKFSLLILEQLCKFIINTFKKILNYDSSEYNILNKNLVNKPSFKSKIPVSFCNIWALRSILENSKIKQNISSISNKDLCNEFEIYLSCDIMTSIHLVVLIIKQLPDLLDPENTKTTLLKESTITLLLELVSSCLQFYNKHGKTLHRIANNKENSETDKSFPPFFASSLISVVISSLNIPTYIIETLYSENRRIILRDSPSDFSMAPHFLNVPLITRINAIIEANPLIETFNNDITLKVLPLLNSLIQMDYPELEKNKYLPVVAQQRSLKEENSINNSFELLKPPKVPFLIWDEIAHISLLNTILSCLVSLSSTTKGCISILKSNILAQIISREFTSVFLNTNGLELSKNVKHKYLDYSVHGEYLNKGSFESLNNNLYMRLVTYVNIGYGNSKIIRNPMHIIWCNIIFIITKIFNSIAKLKNSNLGFESNNYPISGTEISRSEDIYKHKQEYNEVNNKNTIIDYSIGEKSINSLTCLNINSKSSNLLKDIDNNNNDSFETKNKMSIFEGRGIFLKDNLQIKKSIYKLMQLIDTRIQFVLSDSKYISQLAMLEEFNLTVDLVRSALALNFNEFNSHLVETLRKALRTIRNISVISLGRGITESFDLFKPVSLLEKTSAGHKIETLNIYYLDNHLPAQVPSIFHQRCCALLLNSIRSIIDTFITDSSLPIEFKGRELLIQLLHDAMDLGRPILQLLEDVPNHCYSVFTIIDTGKGVPLLPLALNLQGIRPSSPTGNEFLSDVKLASLNKNIVEFKGVAKISPISESCCLPEMITLKSFIQLLSSLIDIFAICGIKCLYTLESLESTDQHNDTVRRFLEFLHLAQGLNSPTLLESSRKLVEMVYHNLKSKLGDQINVEVASLVGIKKDPIHSLLFDRLSNINNSMNN